MLSPGDPAPLFTARSSAHSKTTLDAAAGQYIVLSFFGSGAGPEGRALLDQLERHEPQLAPLNAILFGVSTDEEDQRPGRLARQWQRSIFFWDFDRAVSRLFGAMTPDGRYVPHSLILDPALRVRAVLPFGQDDDRHLPLLISVLGRLPRVESLTGFAPVLTVPFVFERDLCRRLIDLYETNGGRDIGTLAEVNGQTVRVVDGRIKRRRDFDITDASLIAELQDRLRRRLVPEIKRSFQFDASRIERHVVACYDAAEGGHFRPHRDDSTAGSAHRRFAVTINLNAEEYEGGDLRFPEFGCRTYRAPTGGAIVFSCSLLHEVRPLTRGRRYAFLPFLYDEDAARLRRENQRLLAPDLSFTDDRLGAAVG